MIPALLALLGSARADTLVLEVSPSALPLSSGRDTDRIWLGSFSTLGGQPRLGRLIRGEGGANLVIPMVARVAILPDGARRPRHPVAGLTARTVGPVQQLSPSRAFAPTLADAVLMVRVEPVRFDGAVRLQTGPVSLWLHPEDGKELGAWDTTVGRATGALSELPHDLGFWLPDQAWGPQSVRVVYTVAPW